MIQGRNQQQSRETIFKAKHGHFKWIEMKSIESPTKVILFRSSHFCKDKKNRKFFYKLGQKSSDKAILRIDILPSNLHSTQHIQIVSKD